MFLFSPRALSAAECIPSMAVDDNTDFFRRYFLFCGSAKNGFVLRSDFFFIGSFYRGFPENEIASLAKKSVKG